MKCILEIYRNINVVLLAEKDICEFTRAVRNQSHKLLLFRKNRTEL